jgi:hypothetical protein
MSSYANPKGPGPRRAERASSFARVADEYERGRPGYPREEIDRASLRDLASSRSSLAIMPQSARQTVLAKLDLLWEQEPEPADSKQVLLPWRTRVRRCRSLR